MLRVKVLKYKLIRASTNRVLNMTKNDVFAYFGGCTKTAAAIGTGKPAVSLWGDKPPKSRQTQIELITGGFLKAEGIPTSESIEERKARRKAYRNSHKAA